MSISLFIIVSIIIIILSFIFIKKRNSKSKSLSVQKSIKNIYILRTHLWNEYIENTYFKLQEQLGSENVFVLFDETNGMINVPSIKWNDSKGINSGPAIITVNEDDCLKLNALLNTGDRTGSRYRVEAQIIACYKAIKFDYDYMWFFEFDVFSKNFKIALNKFDYLDADLLSKGSANMKQSSFRTKARNKNWYWWNHLIGEISNTPFKNRRGCFFPINRFSQKFLLVLEENLSKSSGYCEVYFPTLCLTKGLKLETIPLKYFGVFVDKPNIPCENVLKIKEDDFRLYHPVKELSGNSLFTLSKIKESVTINN